MLWLCIHLPHLSLEVFSRGDATGIPLVVAEREKGSQARMRIIDTGSGAREAGIGPGMPLGAAYALMPDLKVKERDKASERASLERLASWAGQFTPVVSLSPPRGLLLEVAGSLTLFNGVKALTDRAREGLSRLGYRAVLSLAPTPRAAELFASSGLEVLISDPHELRERLAALPLSSLDLPPNDLEALHGMGLRCLDDCLRQPRGGLARRFGKALLEELDRAMGNRPDPRHRFNPPSRFETRLELPAEVSNTEALLFAIRRCLLELSGYLKSKGSGVRELRLELFHRGEGLRPRVSPLTLNLVTPSRNTRHLLILFRERLDRHTPPAPVLGLGLSADRIEPLRPRNLQLFEATLQPERDWAHLIERLKAHLGNHAVQRLRLVAEHRPERASISCDVGEKDVPGSTPRFGPRPLWLVPEPVSLRESGKKPVLKGALTLLSGPERIESGWWDGEDVARDYFVATDPHGTRLWIFREREGAKRWFLHGIFA
jgi:protein ImuB